MSWWGGIDATFYGSIHLDVVKRGMPAGSEGPEYGFTILHHEQGQYDDDTECTTVHGRLRDVTDDEDAASILAWFVSRAQIVDRAEIEFEFDSGPRYRYEWRDHRLVKLKGVLDG